MRCSWICPLTRGSLEPAGLRLPGNAAKDVELLVLRQQLAVLQRLLGEPRLEPADRALLAALSRLLPRQSWSSFFVTPATLLRRHRELIAGKCPHTQEPRSAAENGGDAGADPASRAGGSAVGTPQSAGTQPSPRRSRGYTKLTPRTRV
ncbi:hypothetical protein ABT173_40590 [Streptomyces sp. NPDC001795]|uniref:hypothetical protein n=1 Tax=unclassified Streptomyces TaxID=2593676 RepID=UPI0033251432